MPVFSEAIESPGAGVLIDYWHPVTKDMGLIQAPVERVVRDFTDWHAGVGIQYSTRQCHSLQESLESLGPLSEERRRKLFLPTTAGWTVFLQSGIDGSDPFPVMTYLCGRLGVLAMRACATRPDATWPAVIWEVYAPARLGGDALNYRRAVGVSNDGGRWDFRSTGEPYPFEDLEAYARPRKQDRFSRELLDRYLEEFGLTPFSDGFYSVSASQPAMVLERRSRWDKPPREFTLEEVSAGVPWPAASAGRRMS